MKKTSVTT